MESVVRRRLRFSALDDITLLREILSFNPYEDTSRWKIVQQTVIEKTGKKFSTRAVREHTEHLLKLWAKDDSANLRRSGSEKEYREKENLLERVYRLYREYKDRKNVLNSSKTDHIMKQEIDVTDLTFLQYEESMSFSDSEELSDPLRAETSSTEVGSACEIEEPEFSAPECRKDKTGSMLVEDVVDDSSVVDENYRGRNSISCLRGKNNPQEVVGFKETVKAQHVFRVGEIALEQRKLSLEERRLKLEEEKWKLEKEEREKRLAMEIEERRHKLLSSEKQLKLLDFLVQQINKN